MEFSKEPQNSRDADTGCMCLCLLAREFLAHIPWLADSLRSQKVAASTKCIVNLIYDLHQLIRLGVLAFVKQIKLVELSVHYFNHPNTGFVLLLRILFLVNYLHFYRIVFLLTALNIKAILTIDVTRQDVPG